MQNARPFSQWVLQEMPGTPKFDPLHKVKIAPKLDKSTDPRADPGFEVRGGANGLENLKGVGVYIYTFININQIKINIFNNPAPGLQGHKYI